MEVCRRRKREHDDCRHVNLRFYRHVMDSRRSDGPPLCIDDTLKESKEVNVDVELKMQELFSSRNNK